MLILNCGFWGGGPEVRMCVPPPQTLACSLDSVQPASAGVWGYSFCNSTMPLIPSGFHIYIYAYPHACSHIYIPLLAFWGRAVGQGETESWAPCPLWCLWGCRFGLCSALAPKSSSLTQNTSVHFNSQSVYNKDTAYSSYSSIYAVYVKGRLGLLITHSCLSGPFKAAP